MDHNSVQSHDVSGLDLPSTHRLPTVNAAQAFEDLTEDHKRFLPTSLHALDAALAAGSENHPDKDVSHGGLQKGQITEIWGPPGVGKSTFGMQLAANALKNGDKAVWVDTFNPLCYRRLEALSNSIQKDEDEAESSGMKNLVYFSCPTLPHLIALLCRPTPSTIPSGTSIIIVDSLSTLINHAFPKAPGSKLGVKGNTKTPSPSSRRLQVLQYITAALQKLAATRDVAIVILTQCATRMQGEGGATLVPAINATCWDQAISTRLVLFQDWVWQRNRASSVRFAGIQKLNGRATQGEIEHLVVFQISTGGITQAECHGSQHSINLSSTSAPKRKLGDTDFEIPNSEDDEDYGWQDEDTMPDMPPQWQGSEDLLLGQERESDEGKEDDEEGSSDGES